MKNVGSDGETQHTAKFMIIKSSTEFIAFENAKLGLLFGFGITSVEVIHFKVLRDDSSCCVGQPKNPTMRKKPYLRILQITT